MLHDLHASLKTKGVAAFGDAGVFPFGLRDFAIEGTQFTLNGRPRDKFPGNLGVSKNGYTTTPGWCEGGPDGKPETVWQTPWNDGAPKFPHEFVVEFPTLLVANGCKILPRQDGNVEGGIKDYAIYVSRDGLDWGEPVLKGTLDPGMEVKTLLFPTPLETKLIRFVALTGVDKEYPSVALAEFEIVPE